MKNRLLKIDTRIFIILLLAFSNNIIAAENFETNDLYFNHLNEVNKEWNNHRDACPDGLISFNSDEDRIQLHLELVSQYLLDNTPIGLTKNQKNNRLQLIKALQVYASNKVFPKNKYHLTRQPYFVDESGVHCAVGHLIAVSGHEDLVARIRNEHNYDYIADIKTEGLLGWADEYGFSVEELKWIQPSYSPTTIISPISNGANGDVNNVYFDVFGARIIFSGEFDQFDNLPCLNIGYYKDGQLSCLGNGVNGVVHDVLGNSAGLYVFGGLDDGATVYPAALYDGSNWNYMSIPGRDSAICTAAIYGGAGYIAQVSISHSSIPGKQEIWFLSNSNVWVKKAEVNGIVLDMAPSSYGRVYAGCFDTLSVYNTSGVIDTTFSVNNVCLYNNLQYMNKKDSI